MTLRFWNPASAANYFYSTTLGFGSATAGIIPGAYSNGSFTAAASHEVMSNGVNASYYVEIDGVNAVTDLVVGQSYSGELTWGGGNPSAALSKTTFTVVGFSTAGVVVQSSALGLGNGGWGFKTFLLGNQDASNGQVISGFDIKSGDVVCFAAGTRIETVKGPIAVELLQAGVEVLLAGGGSLPATWIGRLHVSLARRPDVAPIRIKAGALAVGIPSRDLLVSPEHALGLDGRLVPARLLVNGSTILRDTSMGEITYYHVELPRHALLLAEGAPAESWLDTGNRGMFANAFVPAALHGDFEPDYASDAWRSQACAPLLEGGPALATLRARLEGRAITLGAAIGGAPTLWLETIGGATITLPAGPGLLRLASFAAHVGGDHRRLGVGISGVTLDGVSLDLMDDRLALGFHGLEPCGALRWTDGQALLDLGQADHARVMAIEVNVVAAEQSLAIAA
jgi:hypothetical protein